MTSYSNVLVVTTEPSLTQAAVESAVRLTTVSGGVVTLLVSGPRSTRAFRTTRRTSSAGRTTSLRRLYDPGPHLRLMGVPVYHEFVTGSAHAAVLDRINRYGHDLVIVGDRPDTRFVGRSLAARLLRSAPIPVWVQGDAADYDSPIAVAVGPADEEDPGDLLARKLINTASSIASARELPLHVIHAWRLTGETLMRGSRLAYQPTDIEQMGRSAFSQAHLRVQQLLSESAAPTVSTRVHIAKGHAGDVVPDVVTRFEPSLLVVGTMSRRGIPGMIVGNTVERFVGRLGLPLLAVKPHGFASPAGQIEDWSVHALPY